MKVVVIIACCLLAISGAGQQNNIKLTAGRVLFGTGDIVGYGINIDYSRPLLKSQHFLLGAELSFENGADQPKVRNITINEFFFEPSFYSTTNVILSSKLSYYPFSELFIKGLNLTGSLSVGYTNQSREFQSHYEPEPGSQTGTRISSLEYINQTLFGYRITAGYEYQFKKFIVGARLDFSNYTNGDINTLIGLKTGIRF